MNHGIRFSGLIRFIPTFKEEFLVGRSRTEFMRLRENIRFSKLDIVDRDGDRNIWETEFYVYGASLTGESPHSVISYLFGSYAYLKSDSSPVRFGVMGFKPKRISLSVDPKWVQGQKFIVGGSNANNREFTVVANEDHVYLVSEWTNVEPSIRGYIWDFDYFAGRVELIKDSKLVIAASIGSADVPEKEYIGSMSHALARGNVKSNGSLMSSLNVCPMSVPERFLNRLSYLLSGR